MNHSSRDTEKITWNFPLPWKSASLYQQLSLFQQLFQIVTKEKNKVKQIKWDPFSLGSSFVSGRSEEIRTIWLFSSKFEWPLPGAWLQLADSETGADFWEVKVSKNQTSKVQQQQQQQKCRKKQTLLWQITGYS